MKLLNDPSNPEPKSTEPEIDWSKPIIDFSEAWPFDIMSIAMDEEALFISFTGDFDDGGSWHLVEHSHPILGMTTDGRYFVTSDRGLANAKSRAGR